MEVAHQILQFRNLNGWREGVTVNAGVVSGGTVPNVVPDFAQVRFDLRFLTEDDRKATERRHALPWLCTATVRCTSASEGSPRSRPHPVTWFSTYIA